MFKTQNKRENNNMIIKTTSDIIQQEADFSKCWICVDEIKAYIDERFDKFKKMKPINEFHERCIAHNVEELCALSYRLFSSKRKCERVK